MTKAENIKAFADAGYVLIPLNGKIPTVTNWQETAPGAYPVEQLVGGNYGVALKPGDVVVDIDPRNFTVGDNPVKRLIAAIGPLKSFTVRTGGGGLHIYFRKPADILVRNSLKEYPGIEFKGAGRQVVGPGSIHPESGKEYVVTAGTPDVIADAPPALLALIQRTAVAFSDVEGTRTYVNDAGTQGRFLHDLEHVLEPSVSGKGGDANAYKVACRGRDLGLPPAVVLELMLEVWNKRCSPSWDTEELRAKVSHAYKYAAGAVGASSPQAAFDKIATPPPAEEPVKLTWDTSAQGQLRKTFNNLMNYLRSPEHGLHKIFAYNEFTGKEEFISPGPWHRGRLPRVRAVQDRDLALLKGHLAARHGYDASIEDLVRAITNVAYHERFHPVRQYLDGLKWDGVPRLDTWLRDHLGVEDNPYTRACASKVLCAAVWRVREPGVKFDHVLVLEGTQDLGKSSAIEILAGPWHTDSPVDPHHRDTIDLLQGRWIVEMAEMEVTRRTEEEALKAFISRKVDMARMAFGRMTSEFPRQSVFIATKNPRTDGTYLKDETGNRRWWPVRCAPTHGELKQIDFNGLTAARDQLFAEADVRVRAMKHYRELSMDTVELKAASQVEAGKRHAEHEWTEAVALWLERADGDLATRRDFYTGRDIFVHALNGVDRTFDRKGSLSVASVMRTLGWHVGYKRVAGRFARGYLRNAPTVESTIAELDACVAELV